MGRLGELWALYRSLDRDDPKRKELQMEINKIERYCIEKGYEGFTVTKFHDDTKSNLYPWHTGAVWFEDIEQVASLNEKGINYTKDNQVHVCEKC